MLTCFRIDKLLNNFTIRQSLNACPEEIVDDGSDCDDLVEEAYAYLVSKKYPECVSETKKRVIRRKAAKLTTSVEGELLYKHKQRKEKVSSV